MVGQFERWLVAEGWQVHREVDYCDVVAHRGEERLFAEAKGRTASIGLDVDTLYGQLLRRVPTVAGAGVRLGVVVPTEGRTAALRVAGEVRRLLGITVYVVGESGAVTPLGPEDS
ncbi:hypothetical protein [Cellulomonas endophytica]|uniref:hypothetical protein n=1 Tax=Cellulomonas endophytica TaxID=2494735 RepID=UPI00101202EB|nr:hypothetical protein [Cellulomonas endophytica]